MIALTVFVLHAHFFLSLINGMHMQFFLESSVITIICSVAIYLYGARFIRKFLLQSKKCSSFPYLYIIQSCSGEFFRFIVRNRMTHLNSRNFRSMIHFTNCFVAGNFNAKFVGMTQFSPVYARAAFQ